MSVERKKAASWFGGLAATGAAGIAAVFYCTPAAAVAGAGVAASGGILRNPWLITAGILIVVALAIPALVLRRSTGDAENCCPPTVTDVDLAVERETPAPQGSHRVTAGTSPTTAGTNRTVPVRAIPARPPSPGRLEARTGPVPPTTGSTHPGVASPGD